TWCWAADMRETPQCHQAACSAPVQSSFPSPPNVLLDTRTAGRNKRECLPLSNAHVPLLHPVESIPYPLHPAPPENRTPLPSTPRCSRHASMHPLWPQSVVLPES